MQTQQLLRDFGVPQQDFRAWQNSWPGIWNEWSNYPLLQFSGYYATGGFIKGDPQPYQAAFVEEIATPEQVRILKIDRLYSLGDLNPGVLWVNGEEYVPTLRHGPEEKEGGA